MSVVREVPLQLCDEWVQLEISRRGRHQVNLFETFEWGFDEWKFARLHVDD